jgi:hypothetical protein
MAHYIAMSGSFGCLPDWTATAETRDEALDVALDMWGEHMRAPEDTESLKEFGFLALPSGVGAEYVEVTACDCTDPSIHEEI